jgi:hypothetical protein
MHVFSTVLMVNPLETRKFHFGAKIQILILSGKITSFNGNKRLLQFLLRPIQCAGDQSSPAGGVASLKIRNAFCDG